MLQQREYAVVLSTRITLRQKQGQSEFAYTGTLLSMIIGLGSY